MCHLNAPLLPGDLALAAWLKRTLEEEGAPLSLPRGSCLWKVAPPGPGKPTGCQDRGRLQSRFTQGSAGCLTAGKEVMDIDWEFRFIWPHFPLAECVVNKVGCHTRCRLEISPWGIVSQAKRRSRQGPGANEKPRHLGHEGERRSGGGPRAGAMNPPPCLWSLPPSESLTLTDWGTEMGQVPHWGSFMVDSISLPPKESTSAWVATPLIMRQGKGDQDKAPAR